MTIVCEWWTCEYQENIRRISGEYQENIRRISGEYQENIRRISWEYQENIRRISVEYQENIRRISWKYQENIRRISGEYQENIRRISGEYQENVRRISGECQENIRKSMWCSNCNAHCLSTLVNRLEFQLLCYCLLPHLLVSRGRWTRIRAMISPSMGRSEVRDRKGRALMPPSLGMGMWNVEANLINFYTGDRFSKKIARRIVFMRQH